jgi:hypothetical protein
MIEIFQLATSSGVLAGGLGLLKWALAIELRVMKLEIKQEKP